MHYSYMEIHYALIFFTILPFIFVDIQMYISDTCPTKYQLSLNNFLLMTGILRIFELALCITTKYHRRWFTYIILLYSLLRIAADVFGIVLFTNIQASICSKSLQMYVMFSISFNIITVIWYLICKICSHQHIDFSEYSRL